MAEHEDTLYIVSDAETLVSVDRGETWRVQGARPEGQLIGTVITDEVKPFTWDLLTAYSARWMPVNRGHLLTMETWRIRKFRQSPLLETLCLWVLMLDSTAAVRKAGHNYR